VTPPSGLPTISPSRGEIALIACAERTMDVSSEACSLQLPISPLEEEIAGRPEGGAASKTT
jgi:hypothetical protein